MENINRQGGLTDERLIPRKFNPDDPQGSEQLRLFETGPDYDVD